MSKVGTPRPSAWDVLTFVKWAVNYLVSTPGMSLTKRIPGGDEHWARDFHIHYVRSSHLNVNVKISYWENINISNRKIILGDLTFKS